ncbi:MAG TPA: ABC transporter ATP-binding protein [Nocardioides sp.]|uniref:ABC transporter ATP-binding protein n=1 Tax=Nocardioides sp. TaxID=35761 RepID=UPI002CA7B421|nr:ABC transporter ATP-binding protein [Nocardioides sp.]HQR25888.1 ABC transporter ATP-binding protein [Nocardioides sp.]
MNTTIHATGLVKAYGRQRALDGLDLHARTGVTGLLGPNGAGKTTLLRVLATVLPADAGGLRMLDQDPRDPAGRRHIRRRLGYLPQDAGFHRGFTAFEAVDYIAVLKEHTAARARHDEVRRVLDLVGLADVATKKVRALSGGMRQRLGLAQALLGRPEVLVLDEPTVGLDPEQRMRFRDLVSDAGRGRTVILSTHQTEDVAAVCTDVVVVKGGRSLFTGTPAELAEVATGRVWVDDARDPRAVAAWRVGAGHYHHVGDPPAGAELIAPSIEDAYLLLLGPQAGEGMGEVA